MKLIPNHELLQLILGYGADVKVIAPLTLRDQVKKMVERMQLQYVEGG